jgi:hypothetical protein
MPKVYIEHDDGHNEPMIRSYESFDEAVRLIIGVRPTMEGGSRIGPYKDGHNLYKTKEAWLARDQESYDIDLKQLNDLFDEESDNYGGEAYIHCDRWTRVDADDIEARGKGYLADAEKMRKGEDV